MSNIVITAAKRTPVGSFLGAYANTPAHELGRIAIEAALAQAGLSGEDIDEVLFGQVLTAGQGQNPTRQAAINAGIPKERTAITINQVCGSGLRSVAMAAQAISLGDARIMIAGGQENMSLSPHAQNLRGGIKMGTASLVDTMVHDGLTDAFNAYHMGLTAENLAEQYQITRDEQDSFAVHLPIAVAVLLLGAWYHVTAIEWGVLVLTIGMVLAAELMNTAIEHLSRAVTRETHPEIRDALDVASGAVLATAIAAVAVGATVFVPRWVG